MISCVRLELSDCGDELVSLRKRVDEEQRRRALPRKKLRTRRVRFTTLWNLRLRVASLVEIHRLNFSIWRRQLFESMSFSMIFHG